MCWLGQGGRCGPCGKVGILGCVVRDRLTDLNIHSTQIEELSLHWRGSLYIAYHHGIFRYAGNSIKRECRPFWVNCYICRDPNSLNNSTSSIGLIAYLKPVKDANPAPLKPV
jgi:hypothetical protein